MLQSPLSLTARDWHDGELATATRMNSIRDDLLKLRAIGAQHVADPTGVVDATAAIQALIDAAPPGDFVYLPVGRYRIDAAPGLVLNKPFGLRGDGARCPTQAVFGDSAWNTDDTKGTLLFTTRTSGAIVTYTASGDAEHQYFNLQGLAFQGFGNNARTIRGVVVGGTGSPMTNWEQSHWSDVEFLNLAIGAEFKGFNVNDNEFRSLRFRGCDVGIAAAGADGQSFNQNTFVQLVIDVARVGLLLGARSGSTPAGGAGKNAFYGGLIANVQSGGWGVDIAFGEENTFYDFYLENGPAFSGDAIRVQLGDYNKFLDFHVGTAMDVEFNSLGNVYRASKYSFGEVRLLGLQNRVEGHHHGALVNSNFHNVFARQTDAGETFSYASVGSPGSNTGGAKYEGADILQLQLLTADGRSAVLSARDDIANVLFRLHYGHPVDGNVEVVTIDASKTVHLGPSAPGAELELRSADRISVNRGIRFPPTPVPDSDPNTFDDYQEGSWKPSLRGAGGHSGQSYRFNQGTFTKKGNRCSISGRMTLSARGRFTGRIILTDLPFLSGGEGGGCAGCVSFGRAENLSGNLIALSGIIAGGGASGFILDGFDTKTFRSRTLAQADLTNDTDLWFSGEYQTAT